MSLTNEQLAALVALGIAGAYLVTRWSAGALNPVSTDNVIYKGTNAVGDAVNGGGEGDFNLGVSIYNWLNDDSVEVRNGRPYIP